MRMNRHMLLGVVALGLALPVVADQDFAPYIGADAKWNQMKFKNNAGGNQLAKNYPQGNLFAGIKFNECVGFEAGYESTTQKTRSSVTPFEANFFGDTSPSIDPLNAKSKTKISGFNANLVGFYPIMEDRSVSLLGSIGLAQLKLRNRVTYTFGGDPEVFNLNFAKRKIVPRATLGIQSMLNECIGVRALLTWERTSAFKKVYAKNSILNITPKDSQSIGLGVFYSF